MSGKDKNQEITFTERVVLLLLGEADRLCENADRIKVHARSLAKEHGIPLTD